MISKLVFLQHPHHISFKQFILLLLSEYLKQCPAPCFPVQDSSSWILIVACRLLLPAGEGDDRVWWQAKAWLARVVPSPSRFLPLRAYGWRHCYPLALYQQSITFAHKLSRTTLDRRPNPSIRVLFEWHHRKQALMHTRDMILVCFMSV